MNIALKTVRLYDHELSDGGYKIRLFLSLTGRAFERKTINFFPGRETQTPAFRALNPVGDLPVLVDGELVLRDAEAILAYLAKRDPEAASWLPEDPVTFGQAMMWLGFAGTRLAPANAARLSVMLGMPGDKMKLIAEARAAFRIMDDFMTAREQQGRNDQGAVWFVGSGPTIADVALFPAIALSRDSEIEHDEYPALRRWIRRLRALPGFVAMPGIPEYY